MSEIEVLRIDTAFVGTVYLEETKKLTNNMTETWHAGLTECFTTTA